MAPKKRKRTLNTAGSAAAHPIRVTCPACKVRVLQNDFQGPSCNHSGSERGCNFTDELHSSIKNSDSVLCKPTHLLYLPDWTLHCTVRVVLTCLMGHSAVISPLGKFSMDSIGAVYFCVTARLRQCVIVCLSTGRLVTAVFVIDRGRLEGYQLTTRTCF